MPISGFVLPYADPLALDSMSLDVCARLLEHFVDSALRFKRRVFQSDFFSSLALRGVNHSRNGNA